MAAVSANRRAHSTLGAGTADTVTLNDDGIGKVRVLNRATATGIAGANDIFFVVGSTPPTVGVADSYVVQPGASVVVDVSGYTPTTGGTAPSTAVVSLISTSAVAYSVEGFFNS